MGIVYVDTTVIGTFSPDIVGTSGYVYVNTTYVGAFTLALAGNVYVNTTLVGTYTAYVADVVLDARYRTKIYLDSYLNGALITKDDGSTAVVFAVIWAVPDYPLSGEFRASANPVDLLYVIGKPVSNAMLDSDLTPYNYREEVPIETYCIDKTGITGTKLKWKAERELRRILETYPFGSHRSLSRSENNDQWIGGTYVFSDKFVLTYVRGTKQ